MDSCFGLDECGVTITGQHIGRRNIILECRMTSTGEPCSSCGSPGIPRGTVSRTLIHAPQGLKPVTLVVRVRRFTCAVCKTVWRQDISRLACPKAKLSHAAVVWALFYVVVNRMSIARVAGMLGVSWNTANTAVLNAGVDLLINDPERLRNVKVIGVDEHVWRHTRHGDRYVTVIIDLTPVRCGTGSARLIDMVEGRSQHALTAWLEAQSEDFRRQLEIVAMDGFTGYKTATTHALPDAVPVMDPFHVVALAGAKLDECRQRVQQETLGRRGKSGDPLYGIRRVLRTGQDLLTARQTERLERVFAEDKHVAVEVTWIMYQKIVAAYRADNKKQGRNDLLGVIIKLSDQVPQCCPELKTLGRTLVKRAEDILAYFTHPHTSNGPTEAINGRLEHLRGTALGFRNLTNYIIRSLLDCGGFRPLLHP